MGARNGVGKQLWASTGEEEGSNRQTEEALLLQGRWGSIGIFQGRKRSLVP